MAQLVLYVLLLFVASTRVAQTYQGNDYKSDRQTDTSANIWTRRSNTTINVAVPSTFSAFQIMSTLFNHTADPNPAEHKRLVAVMITVVLAALLFCIYYLCCSNQRRPPDRSALNATAGWNCKSLPHWPKGPIPSPSEAQATQSRSSLKFPLNGHRDAASFFTPSHSQRCFLNLNSSKKTNDDPVSKLFTPPPANPDTKRITQNGCFATTGTLASQVAAKSSYKTTLTNANSKG